MTGQADGESCWRLRFAKARERLTGGVLLGRLLGGAATDARLRAVDDRGRGEAALVRRAFDVDDRVRDAQVPPRELLLELGLVVDVLGERVVDPIGERGEHDGPDELEAVLEVESPERRLDERRQDVSVDGEALGLLAGNGVPCTLDELPAEPEVSADGSAALARDDMRPELRKLPFRMLGEALVELAGDREAEDAVAEELQALVRVGAARRPGRVREDAGEALLGERFDQLEKLRVARLRADGPTDGWRCNRRPARRSECPGRPRRRS